MRSTENVRISLYDYCRANGLDYLLDQWDEEENLPLTPKTISYGSRKKPMWVCEKGHRWQTAVYGRVDRNLSCPICAGKQVLAGYNDLASQYPSVAAQWDTERNASLTPDKVSPGSHRKVWWICDQGHSWQAVIKSRTDGCGCPVCMNRILLPGVNDLASQYPDLASQWDSERNEALRPDQVNSGSQKKVWWTCEKGHHWKASISSRVGKKTGCPYCCGKKVIPGENDLASFFPDLAEQWDREKNLPLTPETVSPYSNRNVWWTCSLGHSWRTAVAHRSNHRSGCPYCTGRKALPGFNDLATLDPYTAGQWAEDLNGALTPQMVTIGSQKKVWWRCEQGHVWQAKVHSRAGKQKTGCPYCSGRRGKFQERYTSILQDENPARGKSANLP